MMALLKAVFTALGRRVALWGAFALILVTALALAAREGRLAARAHIAIRAADARIGALRKAQKVTHEIDSLPDAERDRRLSRWMRD